MTPDAAQALAFLVAAPSREEAHLWLWTAIERGAPIADCQAALAAHLANADTLVQRIEAL